MAVTHPLTAPPDAAEHPSPALRPAGGNAALDDQPTAGESLPAVAFSNDIDHARNLNAVLSDDHAGPIVSSLLRAAQDLDVDAVTDAVRASIVDHGVVWTWERLIHPVWNDLTRDRHGDVVLAVPERLFGRSMSEVLIAAGRAGDRAPTQVLLACADEEHHSLPLDAVAAALAETGIGSCVLGARVPPRALTDAIARLHPAVVVIWSHTSDTADSQQIASTLTARCGPAVIPAGPGWNDGELPLSAGPSTDVGETLQLALALLGRDARSTTDDPAHKKPDGVAA